MDEKQIDGSEGSASVPRDGVEDKVLKLDPLELGKVMVRKLYNAAITGSHSSNQSMDRREAARQLLELAANAVESVDRLFLEKQFKAEESGLGSKEAVRQIVTIASSATVMIELLWNFYDGSNCQNLRNVAAARENFPLAYTGLRSEMAERLLMFESLGVGSDSPFKEADGKSRGRGMADDKMRMLIKMTYAEIEDVRSWSGKLYRPNPPLEEAIRNLPPLSFDSYRRWAPVMAEMASLWGGTDGPLYQPGTWLHEMANPKSALKRNAHKKLKKLRNPSQRIAPPTRSGADPKKLLEARIEDRLKRILKRSAPAQQALTNS